MVVRLAIKNPRLLTTGIAKALVISACAFAVPYQAAASVCLKGVNLSGAEYGDRDGVYGTNYRYPSEATIRYFADQGMNVVRLPFRWARLQRVPGMPLDEQELARLKASVDLIRANGMSIVLDPHDFGYYEDRQIGSQDFPARFFADFWVRLAIEFSDQDDVAFGLMNEPYDIQNSVWLAAANQAIAGIRATGAENLILVPGTNWSGITGWWLDMTGGPNAEVMANVKDPAGNFALEVHQYMDIDSSGTHETCPNVAGVMDSMERFTQWLDEIDGRAFLGEFGGSKDPECLAGLEKMVGFMDAHPDRWIGWTYWAAGDWWPESEGNNIQPTSSGDRPQLGSIMSSGRPGEPVCLTGY
ncbi:glycoside hydrolase family 5 protein [Roseibium denhamense]|uniref:Cellulase family 5 n=1 Tax=Roseibium denhamense TaxID=76305 RepID=A0ABY1PIZ9_9HYPH|nr:glycoside hydrolase family 5 protein [Roseibium denhamense]MTI05565.1 glycoside hydrolase family 5 protein [Roseibium denhamense]SMP34784.1 Cellulase family 5 [Roseibium denhamense]